jgi:NAD+ kinase
MAQLADSVTLARVGLVVHPSRDIDGPLHTLRAWSDARGIDLVQIHVLGQVRRIAELGVAADCDLIVAIGGDGTTLAAIRTAAAARRPVLGAACGSLGVLTAVPADRVADALDRVARGDWTVRSIPALDLAREGAPDLVAFNDVAIVRAGEGQVRVSAHLDGVLFARMAGDGCVVCTPAGSSAYTLAAGGPLLTPGVEAFVLTPLLAHGGCRPPLVMGLDAVLRLEATTGHGGARLEVDGQVVDTRVQPLRITYRPDVAAVVSFDDQDHLLTGLRERMIIMDSPRIIADDERA